MHTRAIHDALAHADAGRLDQAAAQLKRLVQREPGNADAAHFLGMVLSRTPALAQAEYFLRRAVELAPGEPKYLSNLGNVLAACTRHAEAVGLYERAIAARPEYAPAWIGLSGALLPLGRADDAERAAREAARLRPDLPEGHTNLAMALMHGAKAAESLRVLRGAARVIPGAWDLAGMVAFMGNYVPGVTREESLADHVAAARALEAAVRPPPPPAFANTRDPDRRLRVAYLSADLREHSVARFVEALVVHHDRAAVEVVCASTAPTAGATADRLRRACDIWLDLSGLGDAALADRLRRERIDVLVELSGLSAGHRLGAVARRPAPVICSSIGYPNTTGLPAVGYRIVDALTDPSGAEAFATERLVRLDRCFLCYTPPIDAPARAARTEGPVTFGSFNALAKINDAVLDAWASVLRSVPGSTLVIKPVPLGEGGVRARLEAAFAARGVDPKRIEPVGYVPLAEHLGLYNRIDVALDTFPYNGTTTTCEALWMGVPVVALAGEAHAGRVGLSLLSAVGHPELAAASPEGYGAIAAGLAGDRARLASLQAGLREEVRRSTLCDAPAHCRALEEAYRRMWRAWCGSA